LLQDLAHEIAHFWWNFGAGPGDWINEAFAEYSSSIAVEQIVSEKQFQKVLEGYRSEVGQLPADAPSLDRVPFDGSGFVVRYYKGSLMLDAIRQTMGNDAESVGTEVFRRFWKQKLGDKGEMIDTWLDSAGGLPQIEKRERPSL